MTRFTLTHVIACDEATFWRLYLDSAVTRALIVEGLGFESCEIPLLRDEPTKLVRVTVARPRLELPDAVAKLLGPRLSYREEGTFDKERRVWEWTTELAVLSDKIQLGGSMRTEPAGPDRCRRIADLWVRAKIFALGGIVEKAAERNLRKGWQQSADWLNDALARGTLPRPADPPAPTPTAPASESSGSDTPPSYFA